MNIYVGNIAYNATNEQLESAFAQYGAVESAKIIIDRDTNRSKGFGFVVMTNDNEALDAIEALNNADFLGRPMKVNEARSR
ncbi:MAG: RNA-binding protein [Spirochaetales bacterium]|nr:RNA-binding protein [Spirochaetales bacterium]